MVLWKFFWRAAAWKLDCLTKTIGTEITVTRTEYKQGVVEISSFTSVSSHPPISSSYPIPSLTKHIHQGSDEETKV